MFSSLIGEVLPDISLDALVLVTEVFLRHGNWILFNFRIPAQFRSGNRECQAETFDS